MKKRCGFLFTTAVLLLFAVTLAGCENVTVNNPNTDGSTPTLLPGTYICVLNGQTGIMVLTIMKTVSSFKMDNTEVITSGGWNQTGTTLSITLTYINGTTQSFVYKVTSVRSFSGNGENWSR